MFRHHIFTIAVLAGVAIAGIGDVCRAPQGSGTCKAESSCTNGILFSLSYFTPTVQCEH